MRIRNLPYETQCSGRAFRHFETSGPVYLRLGRQHGERYIDTTRLWKNRSLKAKTHIAGMEEFAKAQYWRANKEYQHARYYLQFSRRFTEESHGLLP